MNCPICGKKLVDGAPKGYETLSEHVCDPNGPCPEKPTLRCQNPLCLTFGRGFWGTVEGSFYSDSKDGIEAEDVMGLPGNIDEDIEKKENKVPRLKVSYRLERAGEIIGNLPMHKRATFGALKILIAKLTCTMCNGTGYMDQYDRDDWRIDCFICKGSGIGQAPYLRRYDDK